MTRSVDTNNSEFASAYVDRERAGGLHENPFFVFLAASVSLGLYVPFWILRTVRQRPAASILQLHPRALAIASLAPPMASLVFFQILVELKAERPHQESSATRLIFLIPALHLILALVFGTTAVGSLWGTGAVLLSIPLALMQRVLNNIPRDGVLDRAPAPRWIAGAWITSLLVGVCVLAGVIWRVDLPAQRMLFRTTLGAEDRIPLINGALSVLPPGDGWVQVESGTLGDDDTFVELAGPGSSSWLIAYAADPTVKIESIISARRNLVESDGKTLESSSRIFFWNEETLYRAARSSISQGDGRMFFQQFETFVVEHPKRTIEFVGFSNRTPSDRPDFESTFRSLEFAAD